MHDAYVGLHNGEKIEIGRLINQSERSQIFAAVSNLNHFSKQQRLYSMVRTNGYSYAELLAKIFESYGSMPILSDPLLDYIFDSANTVIINYLSSTRIFTNHTELIINKKYGKDSEQMKYFNRLCSYHYDQSFSYRLLSKLRNYTQHYSIPISSITIKIRSNGEVIDTNNTDISIILSRDTLLERRDLFGGKISKEIESQPSNIDITPHIFNMMLCIDSIYIHINCNTILSAIRAIDYLSSIFPTDSPGIHPCLCEIDTTTENKRITILEWIPIRIIGKIHDLRSIAQDHFPDIIDYWEKAG